MNVFRSDLTLFNGQDALLQCKAKAASFLFMRRILLIEFIKDVLLCILRKPRALIFYGKSQFARLLAEAKFHCAALWTKYHRVGDQIIPHMAHHLFVAEIGHPIQFYVQFYVLLHPGRFQRNHRLPDLLIQAVLGLVGGDLLVLQLA